MQKVPRRKQNSVTIANININELFATALKVLRCESSIIKYTLEKMGLDIPKNPFQTIDFFFPVGIGIEINAESDIQSLQALIDNYHKFLVKKKDLFTEKSVKIPIFIDLFSAKSPSLKQLRLERAH